MEGRNSISFQDQHLNSLNQLIDSREDQRKSKNPFSQWINFSSAAAARVITETFNKEVFSVEFTIQIPLEVVLLKLN